MNSDVIAACREAFRPASLLVSARAHPRSIAALSAWLVAGGLVVAAPSAASAQSLDQAIAAAVTNSCAALGGSGNVSGNLSTFCAAGGVGGGSAGGGGTTASQSGVGTESEGKVKKRLKELRGEADAMTGMSAGESTFGSGALSGFAALDYQNIDKETTAFTSGFDSD